MMSELPKYQLRQGHHFAFPKYYRNAVQGDYVMLLAPGEDIRGSITTMHSVGFEKHFVAVDVEELKTQIAIITEKVFYYGCMTGRGEALTERAESYIDNAEWNDELLVLLGYTENDNG